MEKWIKFTDNLPPIGQPVLAWNHKWIDEDFNPSGIREGFLQDGPCEEDRWDFVSAMWCGYHDEYHTISKAEILSRPKDFSKETKNAIMPEYWMPFPVSPNPSNIDKL